MRLKITPEVKDMGKLEKALDEFAKMSDETYRKTAEKWETRIGNIPLRGGKTHFPPLAFDWLLDENDKDSRIFFVSAATPLVWKFFKLPQKKMEKELAAYLKDVHGIKATVKYTGD